VNARSSPPNNSLAMRDRVSRLSLPIFLAIAIAGCATTRTTQNTVSDPADLHEWQASGRIAVSGANEGGSGSFTWQQQGADAIVQLHGPVGIGSLRIALSDTNIDIKTGDGHHYTADDAEAELADRLGAKVPAQDLRYWLVGVAAPGAHEWSNAVDSATLVQHEWRIDYQRFGTTSGLRLPTKLVAASGSAKVRIVIDRWKLPGRQPS
jgi:outer membrane lipoprotein LolB